MMRKMLEQYMDYLKDERKVSMNTVQAYASDIACFFDYLATNNFKDISLITEEIIQSYLLKVGLKGVSNATVLRRGAALKSLFIFLHKHQHTHSNPTIKLIQKRTARKTPDIMSRKALNALLAAPNIQQNKGLRDAAILELICATGLKVSEICQLKRNHILLDCKRILCYGKAHKQRLVPFGKSTYKALLNYIESDDPMGEHDYFFQNPKGLSLTRQAIWKVIKRNAALAGIAEDISPHKIRNSFAYHLVELGTDLKTIQQMMGYADVSSTQLYSDLYRVEELEENHPIA